MSSINKEAVDILKKFNKKVDRIANSQFIKETKTRKFGVTINMDIAKNETSSESRLHDQEHLDAVLLTLHMFVQGNEPISLDRVAKLYEEMLIDQSYKNDFQKIMATRDAYLSELAFTFLPSSPTRKQIFDNVMMGDKAHTGRQKVLEKWKSSNLNTDMIQTEFERIVEAYVFILVVIRNLNYVVMKNLG